MSNRKEYKRTYGPSLQSSHLLSSLQKRSNMQKTNNDKKPETITSIKHHNIKAMREALKKCANMGEQIDCRLGSSDATVYAFRDERCLAHNISECARAALAVPPRNCEVGTVDEQAKRFAEYCESEVCKRKWCKSRAKALCIERCALEWAQMPYEKEGVGDGD